MQKALKQHPCFYSKAHGQYGRIHLPVAPSCNIQCAYCRRDHECLHENRPGVCAGVLTPRAALDRLNFALTKMPYITVAGIAGPGDAFSEPDLTLRTLELIRRAYPRLSLCLSTNGLMAREHVESLKELDVGFITITVNAINPVVGARLCKSVRIKGRMLRGIDAARVLIDRQLEAIAAFKAKGFVVKVNCVVAPGFNEDHVVFIAKRMGWLGVDLMNLIPLIALPGTDMAAVAPPSASIMKTLRERAGRYVPQMRHCARCRSDAAGYLHRSIRLSSLGASGE